MACGYESVLKGDDYKFEKSNHMSIPLLCSSLKMYPLSYASIAFGVIINRQIERPLYTTATKSIKNTGYT